LSDKELDQKEYFGSISGYSKTMRNFYIELYNWSMDYNKIIYTSMHLGDVHKHWPKMKDLISADGDFWKHPPL